MTPIEIFALATLLDRRRRKCTQTAEHDAARPSGLKSLLAAVAIIALLIVALEAAAPATEPLTPVATREP